MDEYDTLLNMNMALSSGIHKAISYIEEGNSWAAYVVLQDALHKSSKIRINSVTPAQVRAAIEEIIAEQQSKGPVYYGISQT